MKHEEYRIRELEKRIALEGGKPELYLQIIQLKRKQRGLPPFQPFRDMYMGKGAR